MTVVIPADEWAQFSTTRNHCPACLTTSPPLDSPDEFIGWRESHDRVCDKRKADAA